MGDAPFLHAFVLCWPKWQASAHAIAAALDGHVDHLTVLYKNDTGQAETGPGEWRRVPSERYYGWQFNETLRLNRGDVMLHVQADAGHGDWPRLAARCREAFGTIPGLGVWSPNVYHSWYVPRRIQVRKLKGDEVAAVTVTDGVVWALSRAVTEGMARLDYGGNNIGWGLTEAAAAVAMTQGSGVAMDLTLDVRHPRGSGYSRAEALRESQEFRSQLSPAQRSYMAMLNDLAKLRERQSLAKFARPSYWWDKLLPKELRTVRSS